MADGPQAKKSKPGPPVAAAAMARVESSVLGPASAGRRDPPGDKAPAVSPPEIVRDVNVVSDPPSPSSEPPPAPLSLESNRHGTHIGEKTPRLWYIVEVDLYITTYVFRLVLVGMGILAGFRARVRRRAGSGGGQGRRPLVLAP